MADRQLERTLKGLTVNCTYRKDGCEWEGKLQDLEKHLNQKGSPKKVQEGCDFVSVKCPQCQRKCQRKALEDHMMGECMEARVPCDFSSVGCQENVIRKNLQRHLQESLAKHMSLLLQHTNKLAETTDEISNISSKLGEIDNCLTNEDSMSRKLLNSEVAKLKAHTSQQVKGTAWRVSGIFLVVLLAILMAFSLRENPHPSTTDTNRDTGTYSDIKQEIQALKERLETTNIEYRKEFEAFMEENRAERKRLEEAMAQLDSTTRNAQMVYDDLQKLKTDFEKITKEREGRENTQDTEQRYSNEMENLKDKLSNLEVIPQELAALKALLSTLSPKSELDALTTRLEAKISSLVDGLQAINRRVDSLPTLPTLQLELRRMVREELEKLPSSPPPPPPHHGHRCGGKHHGRRGHGHCHHH